MQPWCIEVLDRLPYLYMMPKMHKDGERFISASCQCSTTHVSKILSSVLGLVLTTLKGKDEQHIMDTGIRRFFVVKGYEEVARALSVWKRNDAGRNSRDPVEQHSYDFTTMYTKIPHNLLKGDIRSSVQEAFQYKALREPGQWMIQWSSHDGACWVRDARIRHSKELHTFSLDNICELANFVVDNTFISNSLGLFRQVIGIPMGTNSAPEMANTFLYARESRYISQLCQTRDGMEKARKFSTTFRLIDDLLSVDNPYHHAFKGDGKDHASEIYPPELKLNETTKPDNSVEFLGMTISSNPDRPGRLSIRVFDKRLQFPFDVIRYPHISSNIPRSQAYGVFTGQLHRFYRICTDPMDFVQSAVSMAQYLMNIRGYVCKKLVGRFRGFVSTQNSKYRMKARKLTEAFVKRLL